MGNAEILIAVFVAAFLFFGIANMIAMPFLSRKFFRENGFSDAGKSRFEAYANSEILKDLATNHLYTTEYRMYKVEKAKCHLQRKSLFAFSKIKRRQLQSRWSATILKSEHDLPEFSLLEKTNPNTVMQMLDDPGVDLKSDEEIEKRYLLMTEETDKVIPLITNTIREFLMDTQLASIESRDNTIIIKKSWPIERIRESLQAELDCAVMIADSNKTNEV